MPIQKRQESSFLKKRTKKLLLPALSHLSGDSRKIKVFCFFSSEKKTFLPFFA
jgi:hypothetical protein